MAGMGHPPTVEKINWAWWILCAVIGHKEVRVPGRYLLICRRCGRLNPIRPPDD
jgi:hypothetical protein